MWSIGCADTTMVARLHVLKLFCMVFFQMHPEAGNFGLLDALQVVSAFCSLQSS